MITWHVTASVAEVWAKREWNARRITTWHFEEVSRDYWDMPAIISIDQLWPLRLWHSTLCCLFSNTKCLICKIMHFTWLIITLFHGLYASNSIREIFGPAKVRSHSGVSMAETKDNFLKDYLNLFHLCRMPHTIVIHSIFYWSFR